MRHADASASTEGRVAIGEEGRDTPMARVQGRSLVVQKTRGSVTAAKSMRILERAPSLVIWGFPKYSEALSYHQYEITTVVYFICCGCSSYVPTDFSGYF